MASYSATVAALTHTIKTREDALNLRHVGSRSRFFLHSRPTSKVCLFFHGFTAGPYQFDPIGNALYKAGYNVVVPLMPGHGRAGDWGRDNPPPLPTDAETYQRFALAWLRQVQVLGRQVVIGGLSGGGTVAAWLALTQPQAIHRALLFAPYLSGSSKVIDLFVRHSGSYFEWVDPSPKPTATADSPGYKGFQMPMLRVFLTMSNEILDRAKRGPAPPIFTISSESDIAVGNREHRTLFERALVHQPKCWYHRFNRVLDIPHTMMTQQEGNAYENLLITLAKAYVESDLTWPEVEEIGYRMTLGKPFHQVVAELGLHAKASADMPAMMTMVDKRAIAIARNPSNRRDRDR